MKRASRLALLAVAASLVLASAGAARAEVASELKDLKILSHCFSTRISGIARIKGIKDITKGRYLILKLEAAAPGASPTVFLPDFVLVYRHSDGEEDRAPCEGLTGCETAEAGEYGNFHLGEVSRVKFSSQKIYFGLAFYVEPDVQSVQLYRAGAAEPLTYAVGTARPFSVYITTNSKAEVLAEARTLVEQGGYHVTMTSTGLNQEKTGVTIHYADKCEAQAREISQRLMNRFKCVTTLQAMEENMACEVDILIWFGK